MSAAQELIPVNEMRRRLAIVTTPKGKRTVENDAQRLRDLYVLANDVAAANEYAEIAIDAARQIGDLLGVEVKAGRPEKNSQRVENFELPSATATTYRNLARKKPEDVKAYKAACVDGGDVMSKRGLLKFNAETGFQSANYYSESVEWYTPRKYLDAVRETIGAIDLDPASCEAANKDVEAAQIYTEADNGLELDWRGNVFLNPPYGKTDDGLSLAGAFCEKAISEYESGNIQSCIILVNSSHSQNWQAVLYSYPVCFVDHRIQFVSGDGEENKNPTFQNIFVYLGPDKQAFARAFSGVGYVMEPVLA